jgi:signal transduction histidine kinase
MPDQSGSYAGASAKEELRAWRERALRRLLILILIVGVIPISLTLYRAYQVPRHHSAAVSAVVAYLLVAILLVPRRLPYRIRAWGMLLGGYVLAAETLIAGGMIGNGRLVLVAIPVAAIVLIEVQAGVVAAGISWLFYIVYTIGAYHGVFQEWMVNPNPSLPLFTWIFEVISFTAMLTGFTLFVALIVQVHGRLLVQMERARIALDAARTRVSTAREQERRTVAGHLHDGPVQDLIALSYQLSEYRDQSHDSKLTEALEQAVREVQRIMRTVRDACSRLRSGGVDAMGLEASMAEHATRLMEKSNITVNLDVPETRTLNDDSIAMVLLSTYKEAVNNAVKHSGAREVWVKLRLDEGQYELEVRDEGRGFIKPEQLDEMELDGHYGLVMMKERLEKAGGHLEVRSEVGHGTLVRAWGSWESSSTEIDPHAGEIEMEA